jgi:hypothetical protein
MMFSVQYIRPQRPRRPKKTYAEQVTREKLLETVTQSASLHEFSSATSPGKRRNTSDEDPKFGNRGSNSTEKVIPSRSPFSHETLGHNNGDLLNDSPKPQDIPESSPQVPDNLTIPVSHTVQSGSVGATPFTIQDQAGNAFLQKQLNEAGVQRKTKRSLSNIEFTQFDHLEEHVRSREDDGHSGLPNAIDESLYLSYSNDNSGLELLSTITLPAVILSVEANSDQSCQWFTLIHLIEDADKSDTVAVPPRNINSANTTYGFGVNEHCILNELGGHQSTIGLSTKPGLHWDHVNDVSIEQNPTSVGDFSCEPGLHWDHVNDVSTEPGRNSSSADDLSCEPGRGWTSIYAIPCERRQSWSFPVDDLAKGWTSIDDLFTKPGQDRTSIDN